MCRAGRRSRSGCPSPACSAGAESLAGAGVVARNRFGELLRKRILGREAVDREQLAALRVRRDVGVGEHRLLPRHDRRRGRRRGGVRDALPGGVAAGAAGAATAAAAGPFIIFSILGPWKATTPASSTHSPIASFFCLAFLAPEDRHASPSGTRLRSSWCGGRRRCRCRCIRICRGRASPPAVRRRWPGRRSRRRTRRRKACAPSSGNPFGDSAKEIDSTAKSRPAARSSPARTPTSVRSRKRKSESS